MQPTFRHYNKGIPIIGTSNGTDIVVFLPLFHNPFLNNKKGIKQGNGADVLNRETE